MDINTLTRLINIGRAVEKINNLLDDEIFEFLSKHDAQWQSEHDKEADQLHKSRMKFSYIQDELNNMLDMIQYRHKCE